MPAAEGRTPSVSVVVPAHNEEAYLDQCLLSLVQQSAADVEIIVVDDASSDRTAEIAARHAARDPRVRLLRNTENLGLARTLNRGLGEARGEFLTWVSGDNWADPDCLSGLRAPLADGIADIAYGTTILCDPAGRIIKALPPLGPERLLQVNPVRSCFLFRRRVWCAVDGYDPAWTFVEDYDFWLRCRQAGFVFRQVPGPVVYHRLHGSSMTATQSERIARRDLLLRSRHLRLSDHDRRDVERLVKDAVRRLRLRRGLRLAAGWTASNPATRRARLYYVMILEGAAKVARRFGSRRR